jgi:predicted transcriptional regulator of viral defense system
VTTAELLASGTSRGQLRRLVAKGALVRIGRGGYARAALVEAESADRAREHALLVAAVAALCPGVVASHHSAALVHGLDQLGRPANGTVAVTRAPGGTSSRTGRTGVHLHLADLPAGHLVARHGVPVTSVARTVVDLARASSFRGGVVVADSALHTRQTSNAELEGVIAACARWPGIQAARQVVAFCDGRSESVLESISRVAFRDHGLPPPELQAWIGDETELIGRADFLWRAYRTIGEADGALKYADPSRAMAQLERDKRLREAGFEVVHFTWTEITRTPANVAASLAAAFRRAARSRKP